MTILKNWQDTYTEKFQKDVLVFEHGLPDTDLFSDDALIWLLDNHPAHLIDMCSMGAADHPTHPNRFITGDFRDVDSASILEAAKAGRIWINLREAMNYHPQYKRVLDQMYDELREKSGRGIYNPRGGILISSPVSQTPYHFDKSETLLWHVRGVKRVFIYPNNQNYLPDSALEASLSTVTDDDLPYDKNFDQEAIVIDLKPGQAACWELNSPHRVDNSEFCVSVATEYSTHDSILKNSVFRTNGFLRHKFGMVPALYEDTAVTTRYVKAAMDKVIKVFGHGVKSSDVDMVSFTIDSKTPGFVVPIEPFERNF